MIRRLAGIALAAALTFGLWVTVPHALRGEPHAAMWVAFTLGSCALAVASLVWNER